VGRYTATEEFLKYLNTWVQRWAANTGTEGVCPVKGYNYKRGGFTQGCSQEMFFGHKSYITNH
jgi:hypothetical protein